MAEYKICHREIRTSCVSNSFIDINEAIKTAKETNNLENLAKYESLKKQGENAVPICNGPEAPDICDPKDITTCKGCKNYRNIDKYG